MTRRTYFSPSMAVALIALFVALSGSAYAVSQINGRAIKKRTVAGDRLRNDTVTGRQVKESTLGEVPRAGSAGNAGHAQAADSAGRAGSAARADSAGHADDAAHADGATHADSATVADRLGNLAPGDVPSAAGVVRFNVRMANTDPERTLVEAGPLTLKASCTLNGQQNIDKVFATTSENDGAVSGVDIFGTGHRDNDFDVGDTFVLTSSQEGGTPPPPSGPFPLSGSLWTRSGTVVTVQLAQGNHLFSANGTEQASCTFAGFAIVG
jgi:hypothetical protein